MRPPAKFSTWQAAGNRYLLVERAQLAEPLTAAAARDASRGADGILEIVSSEDDAAVIVIWNADGSQAEMSGNGTRIGPLLERHPRFPERTNVQVARVDGPGEVTARVWERGVGETASSGTSAIAVAAATHRQGTVRVHFPGGDLAVDLVDGRATLTGPAERLD